MKQETRDIQLALKEGTTSRKESQPNIVACQALIESGLLTSLSNTDVGRVLENMKYKMIPFQKKDHLVRMKERMDYFLILHQGTLSIPQGNGEVRIQPGTIWRDQIIGLDVCFSKKKTSYFDLYAVTSGIAVKYDFQRLLNMRRISTVSRVSLLTNMAQYISELHIVQFKKNDVMKMYSLEDRVLLYLLQKEDAYKGSPLHMSYFAGIKKHLGITNSGFSERLVKLEKKGILTLDEKKCGSTIRRQRTI